VKKVVATDNIKVIHLEQRSGLLTPPWMQPMAVISMEFSHLRHYQVLKAQVRIMVMELMGLRMGLEVRLSKHK